MRQTLLILGIVCLIAGGLLASGVVALPEKQAVLSIGDAALSVETRERAPPLLSWGLLGAGLLLSIGGLAGRRR